ncbi:hypothetical protein BKA70DRAFT_1505989 [Coprinopsis sp. MPI-PUGE-AT-0042]|nr:hypothetical protein BKA70DRAFT_1505989 [Coprinopsis sp. MPI-PUGE-AT-0042]
MEHPPADLYVTLADELSTEEELREDPSQARWDETLNILTSLVNTPNAITIDEAVRKINDHFIAYAMGGQKDGDIDAKMADKFMWAFWFYVINVAVQVPDRHPAQGQLVALIKGLHDLPDPVEYTLEGHIMGQKAWVDLPGLSGEVYEAFEDTERYTLGLAELSARLMQEIDFEVEYMALLTINLVLKRPEPTPKVKKGVRKQPLAVVVKPIVVSLRPMEIWIEIAGQKLYRACQLNAKASVLDTSPSFTLDLWNSWKSRVREIKMDATELGDRREMAERIEAFMTVQDEAEDGAEMYTYVPRANL